MSERIKGFLRNIFDTSTIHGIIMTMTVVALGCLMIWYIDDIDQWVHEALGFSYDYTPTTEGQLRATRALASFLFLVNLVAFSVGAFFVIKEKLYRRSAIKSTKGQWYDSDNLKEDDLYQDEPEDCSEEEKDYS